MHLDIQHLRLSLPAGFEKRAAHIARLTGEALAASLAAHPGGTGSSHTVPALSLAPLTVQAGWSDRRVADHIAGHLAARLTPRLAGQLGEPAGHAASGAHGEGAV